MYYMVFCAYLQKISFKSDKYNKINSCAKSAWYARRQHSYNICKDFLSHNSWMKNLNFTNSCTINMNWNIYTDRRTDSRTLVYHYTSRLKDGRIKTLSTHLILMTSTNLSSLISPKTNQKNRYSNQKIKQFYFLNYSETSFERPFITANKNESLMNRIK
jgi:hypothetical protein